MTSHAKTYDTEWREQAVVRSTSPNGQVFLTNHGDHDFELTIDDSYFFRASMAELGQQIERLFRIAFVDRQRANRTFLTRESGVSFEEPQRGRRPHADRVRALSGELAVEGTSTDGLVRVATVGMTQFVAMLDSGLHAQGDRVGLQDRLNQAIKAAVEAQFTGMRDITHQAGGFR